MLQQTQVATVIDFYRRFLTVFPTVMDLAEAPIDAVMALWSGLGYYSRARNLHRTAQIIGSTWQGRFPQDREALAQLPGIGRSTAAAIAVFAFGSREAILDGNVKRVFCRHEAIEGVPDTSTTLRTLWQFAESVLPDADVEAYTQGLMDLGATLCTRSRPACTRCPLRDTCRASREQRTDTLPTRKARKPLARRRVTMLILLRERDPSANGSASAAREVLLQLRPPSGIWGGLWSLPESSLPNDRAVQEHLVECGLSHLLASSGSSSSGVERVIDEGVQRGSLPDDADARRLPAIEHTFTHFRLTIEPVLIRCRGESWPFAVHEAGAARWRWLNLDAAADAPLPLPVRNLLLAS